MPDDWDSYGTVMHRSSCRSPQRWFHRRLHCAVGCSPEQIAQAIQYYAPKWDNWPCKPCRRCAGDVAELMEAFPDA